MQMQRPEKRHRCYNSLNYLVFLCATDTCIPILEALFTLEEIRKTVFSCNPNKAPGSDGMSFLFYQTFWDTTIEADIVRNVLTS